MLRIRNLKDLKKWNSNPTEEKPIVMEWFYNWFFEDVLMKDKLDLAVDAFHTAVEFTEKCEKLSHTDALSRMRSNLNYYSGYGGNTWKPGYLKFLKKIDE